jgi:hypothetical protein
MKTIQSLDQLKDCTTAHQLVELVRQTTLSPDFVRITLNAILRDIRLFRQAKTELLERVPALSNAPDILHHLETVEKLIEAKDASKLLDYDQLARDVDTQRLDIVSDLRHREGFDQANYLTFFDCQMAAVNAYCPENFSFAPGPTPDMLAGRAGLTVYQKENPVLFAHIINDALVQNQPDRAREIQREGAVGIMEKYYEEYIELLQRVSRIFAEKPDRYRQRVASFVATLNLYESGCMGKALQAMASMLNVEERSANDLVLGSILKEQFHVPCAAGSTVYIPGAGYNTVASFPVLQKIQDIQFVLNDQNPFVTGVLGTMSSLSGAHHIRTHEGSLEHAPLEQATVSAVVISLLHNVPRECMQRLAMNAKHFLRPDGHIAMYHCEPKNDEHPRGNEIFELFESTGFRRATTKRVSVQLLSAFPNLANHLELTYKDLIDLRRRNITTDKGRTGVFATFRK